MYITKSFSFESAHSLSHLSEDHKCHRMHGHTYKFSVSVRGEINPAYGWIMDYAELGRIVRDRVVVVLDHRNLNDFITPSTNENLVLWMVKQIALPGLCRIECQEGDGGSVVWEA